MLNAVKIERSPRRFAEKTARTPWKTDAIRSKGRAKQRFVFGVKLTALLLLASAGIAGAVVLYRMAAMNPYFLVKKIAVTGTRMVDGAAAARQVTPVLTGNIFTRDLERAAALMEQDPWVESVSVRTKLPDIAEVAVTERMPAASAALNGKLWLMDEKGFLIEETGRVRPGLTVYGLAGEARPGAKITDARLADAYRAASLFSLDTVWKDMPVAVDVSRAGSTIVYTAGGLMVRFGPDQNEWEEKFMEYLAVRGVAGDFASGFAGYDLSFKNQVVAVMKNGGKQATVTDHRG